ncbi:MAG: excinuclease ABC subunit UvrC [Alphaproteobacteria bacterium]|nr:excinuclease ABC subunit UvrC [Alphaproteobacteria bacterium]
MDDELKNTKNLSGVVLVKEFVKKLPETPGVYRMIGAGGEVLYVGKAKSLKKRVASYTQVGRMTMRLQKMVSLTQDMVFVHTHTEAEALLLESNLIKKLKPRYNILLRDDKSFPYILLTGDHDFAQVMKHRGAKKRKGRYYGPFASTRDVNKTVVILQKVFQLRNCSDSYFETRKRPCLQYHIKRCTAPCVGLVGKKDYARQVKDAQAFLEGKSDALQKQMAQDMQAASAAQDYEKAASYRDKIKALTAIKTHQDINIEGLKNADIMALAQEGGKSCVQVFFFRAGQNYGNRAYFPRHSADEPPENIMAAFIAQFYEGKAVPQEIVLNTGVVEKELLEEALSRDGHRISISVPRRGARKRALEFALKNAQAALKSHLLAKLSEQKYLEDLAALFKMDSPLARIEVYDNSHISGTNMVGAMIAAGEDGFIKSAYRKFNIKTAAAGDDYAMMREVMRRRFRSVLEEGERQNDKYEWPDVLLIDGGKGQLEACCEVLEEYGILEDLTIVAISKGPDRNAGREKFHMRGHPVFDLPEKSPLLHYLQRLRDEAHRYAIGAHRTRRKKDISASPLDAVSGIGTKRKKALLLHFGSAKAVENAGISDLQSVEGISHAIAEKIYGHFHEE